MFLLPIIALSGYFMIVFPAVQVCSGLTTSGESPQEFIKLLVLLVTFFMCLSQELDVIVAFVFFKQNN